MLNLVNLYQLHILVVNLFLGDLSSEFRPVALLLTVFLIKDYKK